MLLENYRQEKGYSYRKLAVVLNEQRRDDEEQMSHSKAERLCKRGDTVTLRGDHLVQTVPPNAPSWLGKKSKRAMT